MSATRNERDLPISLRNGSRGTWTLPGFGIRPRPGSQTLPGPSHGRQTRQAMSLIELMLVLAVIVAVAAIALPALQGPLDNQRLLKSADLIRAQWTRARVEAMKKGQIHVFRYVPASGDFLVEPWSGDGGTSDTSVQAIQAPAQSTSALPGAMDDRPRPLGIPDQRLPDGIQFFSGETQADARSADVTAGTPLAPSSPGGPQPVVFYPDGSTSDAQLVLTNERYFVRVTIRGLTGMVQISDLLNEGELNATGGLAK